jgi:hypothetical protein
MAKRTVPGNLDVYLGTEKPERKVGRSTKTDEIGGGEEPDVVVSFGARIRAVTLERLRDAVYWERSTIGEIVDRAIERELERMEKRRGEPYERRPGKLRAGRPAR